MKISKGGALLQLILVTVVTLGVNGWCCGQTPGTANANQETLLVQNSASRQRPTYKLTVKQDTFGKLPNGQQVTRFTCTNSKGMTVQLIDYGAILTAGPNHRSQRGPSQHNARL